MRVHTVGPDASSAIFPPFHVERKPGDEHYQMELDRLDAEWKLFEETIDDNTNVYMMFVHSAVVTPTLCEFVPPEDIFHHRFKGTRTDMVPLSDRPPASQSDGNDSGANFRPGSIPVSSGAAPPGNDLTTHGDVHKHPGPPDNKTNPNPTPQP
uniref:Uncharacterized protein n=1 Tax=viral metagenome TaxID=1070528 RepID=A0A2V0RAF8_9ZZZZ